MLRLLLERFVFAINGVQEERNTHRYVFIPETFDLATIRDEGIKIRADFLIAPCNRILNFRLRLAI